MKSSDREFVSESEDILEEAESHLLDIQDAPSGKHDPDSINALFRCMHTLKGMSGLYGFQGLADISHALETLLDDVRLGRADMDVRMISFLFNSLDVLKGFIDDLKTGSTKRRDALMELATIAEFRASILEAGESDDEPLPLDTSLSKVLSEYEEHRLRTNIKSGKGAYLVKVKYSLNDFDSRLKELTREIKKIGEPISTLPTSEGVPDGFIGFSLLFASGKSLEELESILDATIEELTAPKSTDRLGSISKKNTLKGISDAQPVGARSSGVGSPTVRVDISKLDTSLSTIGELTVATSTLRTIWKEMSETLGHSSVVIELYRVLQGYERRISELKEQILQIRMVPVSQIFAKLGQVIRRTARSMDKDIRMEVFGEDTEIDKSLAEEVIDPLIHIVRNAIDHGVEFPNEREEMGKSAQGVIRLKSFQRGNSVVIEVSDDGRGLDAAKVRARATDKGILGPDDELTDEDIFEVLFKPGFSTKERVSEISGRGVGLDVVKEKLSSLGGVVGIKSRKGLGAAFTLTLPITLAIIKALIVRVGETKFAVPLSSMSETLVIEEGVLQEDGRNSVLDLRGEILPMKNLREVFRISDAMPQRPFAVVAGMGDKKAVLLVDELLGQQEIVIKHIGEYFENVSWIAGAAEISRQEIILVLDVESIVNEVYRRHKGASNV